MRISTENSQFMSTAIKGLLMLIRSGNLYQWYTITRSYLGLIIRNFIDIFFALPIILAFLGLFFLKKRKQTLIVVLFLLPAVLLQAVLQYGNSWIYSLPRFYYIAYPGVYILAAIFLDRCTQVFNRNKFPWLASSLPWVGLGAIFVLNNLDVWGIHVF